MDALIYIIIIFLVFELYKTCFSKKLYFTNVKSNYIVTNNPNSNVGQGYAARDVEYRIASKNINKEITFDFKYIKSPVGQNIAIYVKKIEEGNLEIFVTSYLIKITNNVTKVDELFKNNNILLNNDANYKYNIKFLSENEYQNELKKQNTQKDTQRFYNTCIEDSKKIMSMTRAIEKCKTDLKIPI